MNELGSSRVDKAIEDLILRPEDFDSSTHLFVQLALVYILTEKRILVGGNVSGIENGALIDVPDRVGREVALGRRRRRHIEEVRTQHGLF